MEVKTMSKISLSDLAQRLAEKSGISLQDAELFIRKMFDVANEGLQSDKLVSMEKSMTADLGCHAFCFRGVCHFVFCKEGLC